MTKKQPRTGAKRLTAEEVDAFEKVLAQLKESHRELADLLKKEPNDDLSKFKIKFINQILAAANEILGDKYRPFPDFASFEEQERLTISDGTFIISQYLGCMEKLRVDNIEHKQEWEGNNKMVLRWYWKDTDRMTYPPLNLKDK
jgi:hypothetical protein